MKNGNNVIIKKINILGSKVNELMIKNKIISSELSHYQKLFNSNKNYISEYFNIVSHAKAINKKNINNCKNNSNNIQKIKDILTKYNSELKLSYENNIQNSKKIKEKCNINIKNLITGTNYLTEKKIKISEDNFLYKNTINAKENLIICLKKDLNYIKTHLHEDLRHIYLNYSYNINANNSSNNNKNNKSAIFEDGERVMEYLLKEEKNKFYRSMKQRIETRERFGRMNIKKKALNDLITSFSFINETEINPSSDNNIFQLLNKKIGGVVKNYENYFNNEIIDENFFIFLPFEYEINKDEISELIQTDITLPQKESKSQTKIKGINLNINNNTNNNSKIKSVPKLDFLQIEFNKEKVEYAESENNNENDNNQNIDKNDDRNIKNGNLDLKIKIMKKKIKSLKRENKKLKNIINDFAKFQAKIKDKFEIYEKQIIKEKEELKLSNSFN